MPDRAQDTEAIRAAREPWVVYANKVEAKLAASQAREQRAMELLDATEADALALLDQHASPEVHNETRARLIKRAAARAALAAAAPGETEQTP